MSQEGDAGVESEQISLPSAYRQLDDHLKPDEVPYDVGAGLERMLGWMGDEARPSHVRPDVESVIEAEQRSELAAASRLKAEVARMQVMAADRRARTRNSNSLIALGMVVLFSALACVFLLFGLSHVPPHVALPVVVTVGAIDVVMAFAVAYLCRTTMRALRNDMQLSFGVSENLQEGHSPLDLEPDHLDAARGRRPRPRNFKLHEPTSYGLLARIADQRAGRKDGRAGLPVLPKTRAETGQLVTSYVEIRHREFLELAEHERLLALDDLSQARASLAKLEQQISAASERLYRIRDHLEQHDCVPAPKAVEQGEQSQVPDRRQRASERDRDELLKEEQLAVNETHRLHVKHAQIDEIIAVRNGILNSRVRQLHEHALRRCATYQRQLIRYHSEGLATVSLLDPAGFGLPDWVQGPTLPMVSLAARDDIPSARQIDSPPTEPIENDVDLG